MNECHFTSLWSFQDSWLRSLKFDMGNCFVELRKPHVNLNECQFNRKRKWGGHSRLCSWFTMKPPMSDPIFRFVERDELWQWDSRAILKLAIGCYIPVEDAWALLSHMDYAVFSEGCKKQWKWFFPTMFSNELAVPGIHVMVLLPMVMPMSNLDVIYRAWVPAESQGKAACHLEPPRFVDKRITIINDHQRLIRWVQFQWINGEWREHSGFPL